MTGKCSVQIDFSHQRFEGWKSLLRKKEQPCYSDGSTFREKPSPQQILPLIIRSADFPYILQILVYHDL